jgi:hypothetical protein
VAKKKRLYGKREPRLPVPSYRTKTKKSFPLKTLLNADQRFSIVKELRARLEQLKEDAGVETVQREWLAARAVFLVARIESLEYDAVTGTDINWKEYIAATKALSEVLKTLGLKQERRKVKTLESYLAEERKPNGKHKVVN